MNFLTQFVNAGKVGGWTRAIVGAGLVWLVTKFPGLNDMLDKQTQMEIAVAVSGLVVGAWSHFAKASAAKPGANQKMSGKQAAMYAVAVLCAIPVLLLALAPAARAADVPKPSLAPISGLTLPVKALAIPPGTPCATTYCTGFYVGFNFAGVSTNANVIGNGINGSLAAGGQNIGLQAGYQYWNGTYFFGPEVFGDYTYGGSPVVAGFSAPKYLFGEVLKFGGPLASFFGGIAPANTTGVSQVLLSHTISPYLLVGAAQRDWGTGVLSGAGITFDIDDHWFVDARYMNIQYTGSNQASPIQTVPQENMVWVGLDYKF